LLQHTGIGSPTKLRRITVTFDGFDQESEPMPVLRHPLSGAVYTLRDDGLVDVDNNGLRGTFDHQGRYRGGDLKVADPHMLLWLAGPQLPPEYNVRRNR
jgi:hypothetical protein